LKNQKTIQVKMKREHFQQLQRQGNFLGTTRTIMFFLHFYIHRKKQLTEEQIETALKEINKDDNYELLEIGKFPNVYIEEMKKLHLYLYTINSYLSALIYWVLENEQSMYKEQDIRNLKTSRVYRIDEDLLDIFVSFANKTGINQGTLINYAIAFGWHRKTTFPLKEDSMKKKRKGLELTHFSIDRINELPINKRGIIINKLIGDIPEKL